MNRKLTNLEKILNIDTILSSIMLIFLIVLTFAGVIARRVFNSPFTWMEEVQLTCMVWIVFAGGSVAFRTGNHIAIEFIVDKMPKDLKKIMNIIIDIIVVAILVFLFYQSIEYIRLFLFTNRKTSILEIPYSLIYVIAPISYILMIINYFYGKKLDKAEVLETEVDNE